MYDELVATLRRQCVEMSCGNCNTCVNRQAADAIEELQSDNAALSGTVSNLIGQIAELSKPRWIPVSERLPESDTNVLVKSGSFVSVWSLREGDVYWEDEYSYFHDMCEVTHWMHLPEPQKEE